MFSDTDTIGIGTEGIVLYVFMDVFSVRHIKHTINHVIGDAVFFRCWNVWKEDEYVYEEKDD